jgi:hypothetical protein
VTVYAGGIGNALLRTVRDGFEPAGLVVQVSQVIVPEAGAPEPIVDVLDAGDLACTRASPKPTTAQRLAASTHVVGRRPPASRSTSEGKPLG